MALEGFDQLELETPLFWGNASGGGLNHAVFWDVSAPGVRVIREDIEGLDDG